MRAEGVVQVLLGDLSRRSLGGEDGNLELLGERLDRRHHRAVELPDDRDRLVLRRQLAESRRALLRRAGVVLDDELDLPPAEDAAARVHFLRAHLRAARDELSRRRVSGRRERREDTDLHGLLSESRRGQRNHQEYRQQGKPNSFNHRDPPPKGLGAEPSGPHAMRAHDQRQYGARWIVGSRRVPLRRFPLDSFTQSNRGAVGLLVGKSSQHGVEAW